MEFSLNKMQQYVSFEGIDKPHINNLFKKLVLIGNGLAKKSSYIAKLGIQPKHYEGPYSKSEEILRAKINELEEDLLKTSEERDAALEENRRRIDDLNLALLSVKEGLGKIISDKRKKEKRIRLIEEKINETIKIKRP
tara:strand:- start:26787 stop:27200 length:414 start_codon:yes stop_codon:yes gene_type:complete